MINTISVLGSTGSVGVKSLEVAQKLGIKIFALSAGRNISLLEKQISLFSPKFVCVELFEDAKKLSYRFKNIKFLFGTKGLQEISTLIEPEIVVNSVSGFEGIFPAFSAINAGKTLALANKESIVSSGSVLTKLARDKGTKILPLDSEHNAIWQCLQTNLKTESVVPGISVKNVKKLILTASGGPFLGMKCSELENVTPEEAVKHPVWNMGAKISVDSATMVNKGLEIIEAAYLFDIDPFKIDVTIHTECVIHSMVEFNDNSVLAQMANADMKSPIFYALAYPKRIQNNTKPLDFSNLNSLSFRKPENSILNLCRKAAILGNASTCAISASNEMAVNAFLQKKIKFLDIETVIDYAMAKCKFKNAETLEEIIKIDSESRSIAKEKIEEISKNEF